MKPDTAIAVTRPLRVIGTPIFTVVAMVFCVGCPPDNRIDLNTFLAQQQQAQEIEAAEAEGGVSTLPMDNYLTAYSIGTDDVLTVTLTGLEEPTISSIYRVRVDKEGEIDLPLVGEVNVGGLDQIEAEAKIKDSYVPNIVRQMTVNIEVTVFDTTDVVVSGSVQLPGLVLLRRTERNLLYAVLGAGGVSAEASGWATLRRVRRPKDEVTFDLMDPVQLDAALSMDPLEDGDQIVVHAAQPNTVYVGGLVNRPAPLSFPPGVKATVLQALAAAGGLRTDVFPTEGTLIRRQPDGSDVQVLLDLDRIQRGEDENIELAAGDILWVPETVETRIQGWVAQNVFLRVGATVTYNATGVEFLNSNAERVQTNQGNLQDSFDPFGFLTRNAALSNLGAAAAAAP